MQHRTRETGIIVALAIIATACVGAGERGPGAPDDLRISSDLIVGPNPTGPHPLGEHIAICKVGGEGTYTFDYSGAGTGSFELQPGQCWELGFFGGGGVDVTLSEAPIPGHVVASIHVDYLNGPDVTVTGTNTITNVIANGTTPQSALVTFTNRLVTAEGCTPGYWKAEQHLDSWAGTGYSPNQLFSSVFTVQADDGLPANLTLLQALGLNGAGANALARHAVAALLNAASGGVNFTYTTADVITMVNAAFASNAYEGTKDLLVSANETTCPLD